MLRGKFGQIGNHLRDGHITMDAFQQVNIEERWMDEKNTGSLYERSSSL